MSRKLLAPLKTRIDQGFESSSELTPEFKSFATKFRNAMKKALAERGAELVSFYRGHFECGGYYRMGDNMAYFSIDDVRFSSRGSIMYRTVEDENDCRGGSNHWGVLDNEDLVEYMVELIA